jgi:hypothetical protein
MRVRGRDHVGPGRVELRVNEPSGRVDRLVPDHDLPLRADQLQVGDPYPAERHRERVDPEVIGQLRVAGADMAGGAEVVTELGKHPERGRQLLLTVQALIGRVREGRVWLDALLVDAERLLAELVGDAGLSGGDRCHALNVGRGRTRRPTTIPDRKR